MKHTSTKPIAAAGTALLAALALAPAASAATFSAINMPSGYLVADSMSGGANTMKSSHEASCGANKAKQMQSTKKMDQTTGSKKMMHAKKMKEAGCSAHKGNM